MAVNFKDNFSNDKINFRKNTNFSCAVSTKSVCKLRVAVFPLEGKKYINVQNSETEKHVRKTGQEKAMRNYLKRSDSRVYYRQALEWSGHRMCHLCLTIDHAWVTWKSDPALDPAHHIILEALVKFKWITYIKLLYINYSPTVNEMKSSLNMFYFFCKVQYGNLWMWPCFEPASSGS